MSRRRHSSAPLLLAALLLVPAAVLAQEVGNDERPDDGFRVLGPRTVVSFVRQTLRTPVTDAADFPRWNTVLHVSNVGNGLMATAAIFVAHDGQHRSALRFPVAPGHTVSVSVADIIASAATAAADDPSTGLPDILPDEVTGIVILRFFRPIDMASDRFFAQMVTAEQFLDLGPDRAPVIVPLDVELPQKQASVARRMHDRR